MDPKFFSSMSNQVYVSLWNKYRPAILQLMMASEEGPQEYKLFGHEFKSLNPKEKGYSFTLQVHQGKALNNIKKSTTAQDLLYVLALSRKATELMGENKYEFTLDKQFNLSVTKMAVAQD
jgi:hypothetical protein